MRPERVAGAVALAEAAIRVAGDFHVPAFQLLYPAPPILALAIVGPLANVIELYRRGVASSSAVSSKGPPFSPSA